MRIRGARLPDVQAIHALMERFVAQGILLPRSVEAIERAREHFLVAVENQRVVGCVSLDVYGAHEPASRELAEIRSLAVAADFQGNGLGARLVAAAMKKAKKLKIARVFAVTHSLAFFEKQGFVATALADLPEKIERDCCRCLRQGWCGQQGAMMVLQPTQTAEYHLSKFENRNSVHETPDADSLRAALPALPSS
ncbi:MAG TPA: GNAT family N-acetyltransferase [Candidatus Acidoferrales bacterium]